MSYELKFKRPEWNGYKRLTWPQCKEDLASTVSRVISKGYDYVITIDGKVVEYRLS